MTILNNSPVLSLNDIIVQLFNNELLADIVFSCNNKLIYAHSFLLMSRSIVYETGFRTTQGDKKLIPIQNYDYDTFYEFVRFIYTDKCSISMKNVIDLLELSVKYKIPKLENMVIAFILENELNCINKFRVYMFCVNENYELLHNWSSTYIGLIIPDLLKSDIFLVISPQILETILKLDYMGTTNNPVKEVDLFNALIKWMNHYCQQNGIPVSERRVKFDKLIKLIRFPIMVFAELTQCIQQSDNLFTDSDYITFFKPENSGSWNCKPRQLVQSNISTSTLTLPVVPSFGLVQQSFTFGNAFANQQNNSSIQRHVFRTTELLLLTGVRIKSDNIGSVSLKRIKDNSDQLTIPLNSNGPEVIVSFGESYVLHPNSEYEIKVTEINIPQECGINSLGYSTTRSNPITFSTTTTAPTPTSNANLNLIHEKFNQCYMESVRDTRLIEIFLKHPCLNKKY